MENTENDNQILPYSQEWREAAKKRDTDRINAKLAAGEKQRRDEIEADVQSRFFAAGGNTAEWEKRGASLVTAEIDRRASGGPVLSRVPHPMYREL